MIHVGHIHCARMLPHPATCLKAAEPGRFDWSPRASEVVTGKVCGKCVCTGTSTSRHGHVTAVLPIHSDLGEHIGIVRQRPTNSFSGWMGVGDFPALRPETLDPHEVM